MIQQSFDPRQTIIEGLAEYSFFRAPAGEDFLLSSGYRSTCVIDASLTIRRPEIFGALSMLLGVLLSEGLEFDAIAGPSSGADPLCAAALTARNVNWLSVRREEKQHGFDMGVITGPVSTGDRVVVCDDVVTTGASLIRAIRALVGAGCSVVGAIVLVDREEFGGRAAVEAALPSCATYTAICTRNDIELYHDTLRKS